MVHIITVRHTRPPHTHPGHVYLSHSGAKIWYGGFISPSYVNQLTCQPPASLPERPWLAMIFFFWSYLSHFYSDFDCVKSKVSLFNLYNITSFLASNQLVFKKCQSQMKYVCDISAIASWILMVGKAKLIFLFFSIDTTQLATKPNLPIQHTKLNFYLGD